MKTGKWEDLRKKKFSKEEIDAQDKEVSAELLEMSLRDVREVAGKTQQQVAKHIKALQAEVSRLERRDDMKLSTLRKYIEACGGKTLVIAKFGNRSVKLKV